MKTVIEVEKLNKYFGHLQAVKDVSLTVKKGEIFGFLGPNGSGKTTTIRMLCGLLTPDSGSGHCLGYDIIKESTDIKQHVGYMTQRFSYYEDMTVDENFDFVARMYHVKKRKQKINEIVERFGINERRKQLCGELSGGWKQRIALAACLLHDPDLLLLDEPTAGVDPQARREFWEVIHELSQQGITTLVSTHYMDEAERCTHLAYISIGSLLIEGTMDEIIEKVNLTTYVIRGAKLAELATKLKVSDGVDQVVFFGETLHVSGSDAKKLEAIINLYKTSHQTEKALANLEDIFIKLVGKNKI